MKRVLMGLGFGLPLLLLVYFMLADRVQPYRTEEVGQFTTVITEKDAWGFCKPPSASFVADDHEFRYAKGLDKASHTLSITRSIATPQQLTTEELDEARSTFRLTTAEVGQSVRVGVQNTNSCGSHIVIWEPNRGRPGPQPVNPQ